MNKISAVICVKNGEETIERALKSLVKNNPFEIIVVDGNSSDRTPEIARNYADKIISDNGNGLGYARQIGAENASQDYIAYIDSDTELPNENVLSNMLNELLNNNWVAIHAQLADPRDDKTYWEQGEDFHLQNTFNKAEEKQYIGTIVCLIRRDIILKYKFDSFFEGAAEDAEFYSRLKKDGYKFGVATTTAYHYHRSSFRNFVKQRIWYGKGNARGIIKHKAYLLFLTPLGIFLYGIMISLRNLRPKMIPFYFVWMICLYYGTFRGLIEVKTQKN